MTTFDMAREHAKLTTQPIDEVVKAGAERLRGERQIFAENGWGEPSAEHIAANVYEAMVFKIIQRGLDGDCSTDAV